MAMTDSDAAALTRYDFSTETDPSTGGTYATVEPHPHGDYVSYTDHAALLSARDQRIADDAVRIAKLEAALRWCPCPRPCNGTEPADGYPYVHVAHCIALGECGCNNSAALAGAKGEGNVD